MLNKELIGGYRFERTFKIIGKKPRCSEIFISPNDIQNYLSRLGELNSIPYI
jgi:hypothetical protein